MWKKIVVHSSLIFMNVVKYENKISQQKTKKEIAIVSELQLLTCNNDQMHVKTKNSIYILLLNVAKNGAFCRLRTGFETCQ